jgi:hypothetical protein
MSTWAWPPVAFSIAVSAAFYGYLVGCLAAAGDKQGAIARTNAAARQIF